MGIASLMSGHLHVVTLVLPDGTRKQAEFDHEPMPTICVPYWDGVTMHVNPWGEIAPSFGQYRLQRTDERDDFGFVVYR